MLLRLLLLLGLLLSLPSLLPPLLLLLLLQVQLPQMLLMSLLHHLQLELSSDRLLNLLLEWWMRQSLARWRAVRHWRVGMWASRLISLTR